MLSCELIAVDNVTALHHGDIGLALYLVYLVLSII